MSFPRMLSELFGSHEETPAVCTVSTSRAEELTSDASTSQGFHRCDEHGHPRGNAHSPRGLNFLYSSTNALSSNFLLAE